METSSGFSVSSISISRWTSGNFDLGAATISRLEVLSGQMRICCPICAPALEGDELLLLDGSGLGEG